MKVSAHHTRPAYFRQPSTPSPTSGTSSREQIPDSYIVVTPKKSLEQLEAETNVERVLGEVGDSAFVLIEDSRQALKDSRIFQKIMPNYQYHGELFDRATVSPETEGQPRHLDLIGAGQAWKTTKGSPQQYAAVTDTGVDSRHSDLSGSFWVNDGETPGDGIDNDSNGYVDDIIGQDVSDQDGDPHDTDSSHHTHVHGIMLANDNGPGATGVAPDSRAMALRIAGGKRGYNSAVVTEAYLYALNQGAKTINTSFNIDGFVGDEAIESTYRALAEGDALVFNSAGNADRKNPRRSVFEDVVLVASTQGSEKNPYKKSNFSNYGAGIDIAAPGSNVLATVPGDREGRMSGTSMASPVAAGVDLLVRSAHPSWNRAQRWAQIRGTAVDIDGANPRREGMFGGGQVHAGRALSETLSPPTLDAELTDNTTLTVRFEKVLEPSSANQEGGWQIQDSEGQTVMVGAPKEVRLMTNELAFDLADLAPGEYNLVASAEVLEDPFGQALDGNGDGIAGDDYQFAFRVQGHE